MSEMAICECMGSGEKGPDQICTVCGGSGVVPMTEIERLREIETAARNLANFVSKSVNAGPLTLNPRQEAWHWQVLREALKATPTVGS